MSNVRLDFGIEYSLIRIPYDAGVKTFKSTKKTIEKEMSSILNSIISMKKEPTLTKTQTTNNINTLIGRLKTLKRKLDESYQEEDEIYECCKKRLLRLHSVDVQKTESVNDYMNTRVNHLILEHLARNDCVETVKAISKEYGMEDFVSVDMKIHQESNTILRDLKNKNCESAFHWIQTHKTKLLRIKSQFEVKLMFQEFIELIKKQETHQALQYLRKYSEAVKNDNIEEIKKAMGCLTFYKQIDKLPGYRYYFEEERWNDLIQLFKHDNFLVSGVTMNSGLEITLQAGLSVLKTENCCDEKYNKPEVCPVCNPYMKNLVHMVPSTHKVVSSLICRISGEVMDEHNPPVALPNGQVYSERAIRQMAERNFGKIICPATRTEYTLQDAKKIFIS